MCRKQQFFICEICKNLIGKIEGGASPITCCGKPMTELVPNTVEASVEKHLPAVRFEGDEMIVDVGSVLHPMSAEHYISFVYVETEKGGQRKCFELETDPTAKFVFKDDKPVAVYAYCNLHGMWKTEL